MSSVLLVIARTTGGTGRHVRVLAEGLARDSHRVSVCGPQRTQDQFDFTGAGARFAAVEISSGPRPTDAAAIAALRSRAPQKGAVTDAITPTVSGPPVWPRCRCRQRCRW